MRDWPTPLVFLVRFIVGGAFVALFTWGGWKFAGKPGALIAFLLAAPTLVWMLTRPLIQMIEDGFTWTAGQPLKKWEGKFYEFDGVHVRVLDEGDTLWFVANDVIKASGIQAVGGALPESQMVEEAGLACLDIHGVEKVLSRHRSHEAGRFMLWARREVLTPWERKRSGALVPR